MKKPMRKVRAHSYNGNCAVGIYDCQECDAGQMCDVCHKHDEPRGECDQCKRCPECFTGRIAKRPGQADGLRDSDDGSGAAMKKERGISGNGHIEASKRKTSGTPTTPNAKRTRPMVTLTLSREALGRLDVLASQRGQTRSGAVEQLVRNARLRAGD